MAAVASANGLLQLLNSSTPRMEAMLPVAEQPPIHFFYTHFHDSIRLELDELAVRMRYLETAGEQQLHALLIELTDSYRFLEQVYKYHSSVEDEVVYPALDSKVRNVTKAYSVEHQDEEILFEQLSQQLAKATGETGPDRQQTIRALTCKVEEIHTTLRKHLAKEEEQLLPLLLAHFDFSEQVRHAPTALLVQQHSNPSRRIPLSTVERVLAWIMPRCSSLLTASSRSARQPRLTAHDTRGSDRRGRRGHFRTGSSVRSGAGRSGRRGRRGGRLGLHAFKRGDARFQRVEALFGGGIGGLGNAGSAGSAETQTQDHPRDD
ncbi:MAG: hypothetical protein WDW38_007895 [Sanguina aurantia]